MDRPAVIPLARCGLLAFFFTSAGAIVAQAQQPSTGINLLAYVGTTARVQDPPGSIWKSMPVADLPKPTPVTGYKSGEWVEIQYQARSIRISIAYVMLDRVAPLNGLVARSPSGSQTTSGLGGPGFGR